MLPAKARVPWSIEGLEFASLGLSPLPFEALLNALQPTTGLGSGGGIAGGEFSGSVEPWQATLHPENLPCCMDELRNALWGEKGSDTQFRIRDLAPSSGTNVQFGLDCYSAKSRPTIEAAAKATVEASQPFDLVLPPRERAQPAATRRKQPRRHRHARSRYAIHPRKPPPPRRRRMEQGRRSLPRADGSLDWARWETRPWYVAEGDIGEILVFAEVVTERKKAELAARASEERYRNLFDNMIEELAYCRMIHDGDKPVDWTYLAVNPCFEPLTGSTGGGPERFEMDLQSLDQ
jgi:PAS domain-containing protein